MHEIRSRIYKTTFEQGLATLIYLKELNAHYTCVGVLTSSRTVNFYMYMFVLIYVTLKYEL